MFTTFRAVSLKRGIGIAVTTVLTLGVMTAVPLSAQAVDAPSIVISQVTETASSDTDPKSVQVPIAISGFDSSPVVAVTLRLTAEDSGTLSIDNTTGLTLTSGFTTFSGESEIGFKASLATATSVLANNVKWHTPQSGGTIPLEVTIGPELPAGVVLNPANGHLYEYVNTGVNWSTALARAKTNTRFGMTGYLLTVTNWTENLFVTSRLTTSNIWLAAGDQSGSWKWYAGPENGSNVSYTRWGFLQPDNWGKFQGCGFLCLEWITEDRAAMNYTFATGFWQDKYYNDNANYVIEYGGLAGETSTYTPFTATADLTSVSRFKSFIDYANNNAGTRPSLLDVLLAELDGITNDSTLNAIISALTTPAIDGSAVDSRTELQTIADAFKRILDYANGISSNDGLTAPTAADFTAIGANISAALNSDKSALVNDVIARRATAEVDEVNELEGLAIIVERLFATTSLVNQPTPALSASDFTALGVSGVTSANVKAARAAVRGKTASQIDSVSELQSLIEPALVAAQALATITNYADANTGTKPTVTDFSNAGVTGVTSSNLKSIQSSLATLLINNVHIPSSTEITSIVNAFDAILDLAGSGTTDVTGEQFQLVGVSNASTYEANVISLVNSIIDEGPVSKFDTANELTSYFNIVNKVISDPASLTVYELWALGFTGVTEENLPYVKNAISASADLSSLTLLTDSVDAGVAAGNAWFIINSYAITNTGPKPTLANYQAAGITQATEAGLGLLNSMLASRPIGLGEIDDDGELSNLAWSADEIVHFYDEVNSLPSDHLWPFFAGAGFYIAPEVSEELSNSATSLFISVANQFSDATHFDTFNEVQALLDITQAVTSKTAGLEFYRYPVATDFAAMGMNNIQSGDLTTLNAILESTADDGTEIDTYTELQNIVDTISTTPFDGTDAQAMVDAFAASKFYFWPTAAMWNTVTGNSNTTLENVYLLNSMAYSPIFTNFTTVTVAVDEAAAKIVGYAGESATAPSKDDYAALKVDQVDFLSTDGLNFFNALVKAMSPSDVTTFEHLNSVAFIVNQLFVSANGMSVYQWHALGYADVTSDIRSDVNSRVAALGTPTFAGIDQAIADAKAAAASWRAIKTYADTNIGDVPTSADFSTIGVTLPATEGLLDAVIDVLASSSITAEDTDVTASVQSIVDAVAVLFAWADGPTVSPTTFGSPANALRPAATTAPTAADYAALNATTAASLTGNALALLNDILADQTAADLDIPGDIEALAFIISVLFYDAHSVPASNILALGGTGVHEDNIADVQNRLYSGIQLIDSVETLQEQINAGINAQQLLLDAIALVQSYSDANSGSAPTLSTYVDLGIVLSDSTMINEINTVWASAGLTSGDVPDLQAIKDVVAAYERVIAGTATASDLSVIGDDTSSGLLVVSEVLPLFNSFNAYLENASTADELSAMATASYVAITSPDSMTFADFQALSLTSVTEDNFGMIKQAMSLVSASARNSRDEILGLVTSGIASGTAALSDLNDFADGYGSAPSVADYEAAGIDGVTADNLATINSMLLAGIPTAPFTASQLQAAFDAYLLILTYANGATSQDGLTVPTDETFNLATNVDMSYFTPTSLAFLVNRLGQLDNSVINTVPELMALIDAVDHLFRSQNELTLADLIALGFTDVTEDTLAAVKAALQANAGSLTDLASIQSLISTTSAEALGALAIIRAYADNQSVVPSVEDYETAGLSGVNQYNLEDVNAAIAAVTASEVNTTAKIQAIIIDVNADMVLAQVVAYANGGATDAPLAGAYKMVGIGGVAGPSEEWAALISMFVHHNSATSYDTLDELLALADATYALSNNPGNLTVEDFTALGFEGVTADNLLIAATGLVNANLSSVESILAALNAALDVTIPQAPSAAGLTSKSVRVTWAAPTGEAIDAVVTIRNGATTVCVADAIAAKCDVVGLKSKTSYTLSVEYSNMGYTKTHSVTASTLKTPGPYKTSKILFNAYSTKISSVGTKALWDALRNVRKHNASMIEITGAVQKTGYTGNDAKLALKRAEKIKTWFRERGVTIKIVVKRSKPVALSDIAGRQATVKLFD